MRVLNHDLPPINSVYDCACALYFLSCVTSEAPSILCMRHRVASSYYVTSYLIKCLLFSTQIVHKKTVFLPKTDKYPRKCIVRHNQQLNLINVRSNRHCSSCDVR